MTPQQADRFNLVNTQESVVNQGQTMTQGMMPSSESIDEIGQGLSQSIRYMAKNGPTRPVQKVPARMITRSQLEEQKMNEAQGLPSNLEDASRVIALEKTVSNLNTNMDKIASLLGQVVRGSQPLNVPDTQVSTPPPPVPPAPLPLSAPLPTPQVSPDVEPVPIGLNLPSAEKNLAQVSTLPDQEMEPPTLEVVPPASPPVSFQQLSPPEDSPETKPESLSDQDIIDFSRGAQPPSGAAQPIGSITMGPTGSVGPDAIDDQFRLTDESSPGESVSVAVIEEPDPTTEEVAETKRLSRQQILTDQVMNWLKSKDLHKFWRQFLAGACNKNLSYNTWPPEFQGPFNDKFKAMVADASFVAALCGRITKMQMGHLVAPHVAGAFVVVTAGFLSFALLEQ